jgi:DNA (cytosine-5)-methyltransferase 1
MDGVRALDEEEMSGSALRQIVSDATMLGYHISFGIMDAADYGAPQHRLRFVMLGSRDHPPAALPPAVFGTNERAYRTVRDAIWSLRNSPGSHSSYTPEVLRFFAMVPEGGSWRSLPPAIQKEALGGSYEAGGGKTGFYRRLAWDRPSPTVTGRANRKGSALCHPDQDRPISVLEAAALQGFPADWRFIGAMNAQYMQIGNAVPVPLGEAIGHAIVKHDSSKKRDKVRHPNMDTMMASAVARLRASARNKVARAA